MLRKTLSVVKSSKTNIKNKDFFDPDDYPYITTNKTLEIAPKINPRHVYYNLPIFGIRRRTLYESKTSKSDEGMGLELVRDYHMALFKAIIKALNCNTVEIATSADNNYKDTVESEYRYVRDPAVILHDKGIIISTEGNHYYCSEDIIRKVQEKTGYKSIHIPNAYFEGGNMFYLPEKKLLIHGLQPGGHYGLNKTISCLKDTVLTYEKVDPVVTNKSLSKALKQYNIHVMGLVTNMDVISHDDGNTHEDYYYHLDCFMQALPDGRVVILNKKMLSEHSKREMERIFGDKFIDLAYPDYLTNPVLLNFIAIPDQNQFVVICPTLPDSIIKSLSKLNLKVITPASLDARNAHYDRQLAERVVLELKKEGYYTMNAKNLGTHLAWKNTGYVLDDGNILPASRRSKVLGKNNVPIDDYFSKTKISFVYGAGGPHCFTTEIVPIQPKVNRREPVVEPSVKVEKVPQRHAFFKGQTANHIKNNQQWVDLLSRSQSRML